MTSLATSRTGLTHWTMVCRVDECSEGRRHGWQLKPIGQGLAIGRGRLCSRGGHLVHCLNEARGPDDTRLECWLKSAHWIFRSTTVNYPPPVQRGSGNRPPPSHYRERQAADGPCTTSRKAAGESEFCGLMCGRSARPQSLRALLGMTGRWLFLCLFRNRLPVPGYGTDLGTSTPTTSRG